MCNILFPTSHCNSLFNPECPVFDHLCGLNYWCSASMALGARGGFPKPISPTFHLPVQDDVFQQLYNATLVSMSVDV